MSERGWLRLILALYALLGLGYSLLMPIWEAPDEPDHYRLALHIAREGEWPSRGVNTEAHQPPLYYWLASLPLVWLDGLSPSLVEVYEPPRRESVRAAAVFAWDESNYRFQLGPQLLRWLNLLAGALTVQLIFRAARRFTPRATSAVIATTALAGLNPQFLHISASVSNAALTNLAGAYLFYLLSRICLERLTWRDSAWMLGVALLLPLFVKATVLPMALAVVAAVLWQTRQQWHAHGRRLLLGGVLIVAVLVGISWSVSTVAGRWEVLYRVFYTRPDVLETFWESAPKQLAWSYWGLVGWMRVGFPITIVTGLTVLAGFGGGASLYLLLDRGATPGERQLQPVALGLTLVLMLAALVGSWLLPAAALGLLWMLVRSQVPGEAGLESRVAWAMIWLAVGLTFLVVMKNALAAPQYQGRYFFPAIGALSLLTASGWFALLSASTRRYLPHLTVGLMLFLNLFLWFEKIIPVFYQPFLG